MTELWMRTLVKGLGEADLKELLEAKQRMAINARQSALDADAEYLGLLRAAADAGHRHAELQLRSIEAMREALNAPTMRERARRPALDREVEV